MATDQVYIWLQEGEEEGQAACGCRLVRGWDDGNPAFIMCAGHLAQEKLLTALKHAVGIAEDKISGTWDDLLQYRKLIAEAETVTPITPMLHGETAEQWAERMFEFETCAECGKDKEGHDIIEFMGSWRARCKSKDYRLENIPTQQEEEP